MDRRFLTFFVISIAIWMGFLGLRLYFAPPQGPAEVAEVQEGDAPAVDPTEAEVDPQTDPAAPEGGSSSCGSNKMENLAILRHTGDLASAEGEA